VSWWGALEQLKLRATPQFDDARIPAAGFLGDSILNDRALVF
jgi:hypothetical protein